MTNIDIRTDGRIRRDSVARAARMGASYARGGWDIESTLAELPHWFGRDLTVSELLAAFNAWNVAHVRRFV